MIDIDDILKRCKKNDKQAQAQLYNWLAPKLLGLCYRYLQNRDEAEDAMQDAFVKVFSNLDSYKAVGSFEGWAKRIAANTALNMLRTKHKIYFERNLLLVEAIEVEEEEARQLSAADIMQCLEQLPSGYRTIINMYLIDGFSHKEIAEKLGIAESSSRSQFARARQILMKQLKAKEAVANIKNA